MSERPRGQIVLLAAVVVALALVPILGAYLQLGYDGDARAFDRKASTVSEERILTTVRRELRGVLPTGHDWGERNRTASRVRTHIEARLTSLSGEVNGTVIEVELRNASADLVAETCPAGPNRRFGPCRGLGAVFVQERAGETHVYGLLVEIRVIGRHGIARTTHVIRPRPV